MPPITQSLDLVGDLDDPVLVLIRWIVEMLPVVLDVLPKQRDDGLLIFGVMEEIAREDQIECPKVAVTEVVHVHPPVLDVRSGVLFPGRFHDALRVVDSDDIEPVVDPESISCDVPYPQPASRTRYG